MSINFCSAGIPGTRLKVCVWWGSGSHTQYRITPVPRLGAGALMLNAWDWTVTIIVCHLPLRGTEEEFLSNNRDIALKVLDHQCKTYYKDDETRELIVKAFDKLIKNNQMVLWDDLTDEEKKIVESKAVNHYIIWRVNFKNSVTTPARTVFDGSQNTKFREDGTGGRCLNDAVVKGRVVTLNLVKMILRFEIGAEAMQGDLKQFYASIKLVTEQWNLQRVLLKDN